MGVDGRAKGDSSASKPATSSNMIHRISCVVRGFHHSRFPFFGIRPEHGILFNSEASQQSWLFAMSRNLRSPSSIPHFFQRFIARTAAKPDAASLTQIGTGMTFLAKSACSRVPDNFILTFPSHKFPIEAHFVNRSVKAAAKSVEGVGTFTRPGVGFRPPPLVTSRYNGDPGDRRFNEHSLRRSGG